MTKQKTGNYITTGSINIQPSAYSVSYFKPGTIPVGQVFTKFGKQIEKVVKEVKEKPQMKKRKTLNSGMLSDEHPLRRLFAMVFLFKCELLTFDEEPCYCGSEDLDRLKETLEELGFNIEESVNWLKQRGVYCDCSGRYFIEDEWGWTE